MKKFLFTLFAISTSVLSAQTNNFTPYIGGQTVGEKMQIARNIPYKHVIWEPRTTWALSKSTEEVFYYYIKDPDSLVSHPSFITETGEPTHPNYKTNWKKVCVLVDEKAEFPNNFAQGKVIENQTVLPWNYQRQEVINEVVNRIKNTVNNINKIRQNKSRIVFAGFIFTDPRLSGEFYKKTADGKYVKASLSNDTAQPYGAPFDYKTYTEGRLMFLKTLRKEMQKINKDAKIIFEVDNLYKDFVKQTEAIDGFKEKYADSIPDFFVVRKGAKSLTNEKNFASGIISKNQVISNSFANIIDLKREVKEITHLAQNGINTTFDITAENSPNKRFGNIPARLRISRLIPTLENMHKTPLDARQYDEQSNMYFSPVASLSEGGVGVLIPRTNNFYIAFTAKNGKIKLPDGYTVDTFEYVNGCLGSTIGYHGRKAMKAVYINGQKCFKMLHWMSKSYPLIFIEKDGFIELGNEMFANEMLLLKLKKVK
ncbi:MAG: hypothetical protein E7035_02445 [Verrucomicrobiaceae bacterium]|nr:hypothetical protein [Verrucomicrobiaceae bacterium]